MQGKGVVSMYYGKQSLVFLRYEGETWSIIFYNNTKQVKTKRCDDSQIAYMVDLCHPNEAVSIHHNGEVYTKEI